MTKEFKTPINIEITSDVDRAGDKENVHQQAQGSLLFNEDHSYTILYDMAGDLVRLEIAPEKTRTDYFGHNGKTVMVYDEMMDQAKSTYMSDYGAMDMLVKTASVDFDQVDGQGMLHIKYELFQNEASLGKFDLTLQFVPTVSTIDQQNRQEKESKWQ